MVLVHEGRFYGFLRTNILCSDITAEMVEHEIRLLTWAISHMGHVNNTDWSSQ